MPLGLDGAKRNHKEIKLTKKKTVNNIKQQSKIKSNLIPPIITHYHSITPFLYFSRTKKYMFALKFHTICLNLIINYISIKLCL